jgi:hypothetical protein
VAGVADAQAAQTEIAGVITALTPAQRQSGDAINTATVYVENIMRRGTSQTVQGDVSLNAEMLSGMTDTARNLQQTTDATLAAEDMTLMRDLRTNINVISEEQDEVNIAFPDDVQNIEFDNVTVEADFAAVTVNREFIGSDSEIAMRRATAERPPDTAPQNAGAVDPALPDGGAAGTQRGIADRLFDFSSPLTVLANFWSVLAVIIILLVWLLVGRLGKKFRLWVVPSFMVLAITANAFTFLFLGGNESNGYVSAVFEEPNEAAALPQAPTGEVIYTDGVEVTMTEGMRATLSLPVNGQDPEFLVLVNENNEIQHSRFNPVTETIDGRIRESGTYTLRENIVSFADIDDKSQMMQDAINRLASRGIMRGTVDGYFFPDDPITRTELVSTIVMAFDMLDFAARTTFTDVSPGDWHFPAIATAQQEGLISGFPDNTFRGSLEMPKDQMTNVAANSLVERMGYRVPSEIESILVVFLDRDQLPGWAEGGIALATQTNVLIHRADGLFAPQSAMTRGDAAIVLYRVFSRVW